MSREWPFILWQKVKKKKNDGISIGMVTTKSHTEPTFCVCVCARKNSMELQAKKNRNTLTQKFLNFTD